MNIIWKGERADFLVGEEALNQGRAEFLILHDERKHELVAEFVFSHKVSSCFRAARKL